MQRWVVLGLVFLLACFTAFSEGLSFDVPPGTYSKNQLLKAQWSPDRLVDLSYDGQQWVRAPRQTILEAAPGEDRVITYWLRYADQPADGATLRYEIDKCGPDLPVPAIGPGAYDQTLLIGFQMARDAVKTQAFLQEDNKPGTEVALPLSLAGRPGATVNYRLQVRSFDQFGNAGLTFDGQYTIRRPLVESTNRELRVFSPVPGSFGNRQLLAIDEAGFDSLWYRFTAQDDWIVYDSPILIDRTGLVNLSLRGRRSDGSFAETQLAFSVQGQEPRTLAQGYIFAPLTVEADNQFTYAFGENSATANSPELGESLRVTIPPDELRQYTLRLFRKADQTQFRYVFLAQGRKPKLPVVGSLAIGPRSQSATDLFFAYVAQTWSPLNGGWRPIDPTSQKLLAADSRLVQVAQGTRETVSYDNGSKPDRPPTLTIVAPALTTTSLSQVLGDQGLVLNPTLLGAARDNNLWIRWEKPLIGRGQWQLLGADTTTIPIPDQYKGQLDASLLVYKLGAAKADRFTIQAEVDTRTPIQPEMTVRGQLVEIKGEGTIMYRVLLVSALGENQLVEPTTYTKPIFLERKEGENRTYIVEAYTVNGGGRSKAARSAPVYIHTVAPPQAAVDLRLDAKKSFVTNLSPFTLKIQNPDPGVQYRYVVQRTGAADLKGEVGDGLILEAPIGSERNYQVRIAPISRGDTNLIGEVLELQIIQDTLAPKAPDIKGVEAEGSYRTAKTIEITGEGSIEYRLTEKGKSESAGFQKYGGAIQLPLSPAREVSYLIEARCTDTAGNTSPLAGPVTFVIDDVPPGPPIASLILDDGTKARFDGDGSWMVNQSGRIQLESGEKIVEYRLGTETWKPYTEPIVVAAIPGAEQRFTVAVRAQDRAGNLSVEKNLTVTIDKVPPAAPPAPRVVRSDNKATLTWERSPGLEIAVDDPPVWRTYDGPLIVALSPEKPNFVVRYRNRDSAGNASSDQSLTLSYRPLAPVPVTKGMVDDAVVTNGSEFELVPSQAGGIVRYKIGNAAQDVDESAPQANGPIRLEIPAKEERILFISYRQFLEGFEPSPLQYVRVTVDAKIPAKPAANIAEGTASFGAAQVFLFNKIDEGDKISYAMQRVDVDLDQLATLQETLKAPFEMADLRQFAGTALNLAEVGGKISLYRIKAFANDRAGNRSEGFAQWNIIIHPRLAFVDPAAQPGGNASLLRPAVSLSDGLKTLGSNGTLVLAAGQFPLRPTEITGSTTIAGSFNFGDWQFREVQNETASILYPSQARQDLLFNVREGANLQLRNVYVLDSGMSLQTLIRIGNGSLGLTGCFLGIGPSLNAIEATNGRLQIDSSRLSIQDSGAKHLLTVTKSNLRIGKSVVEYAELPPSLARRTKVADYSLVAATDSTVTIQSTTIRPRGGLATIGLSAERGTLLVDQSEIYAGSGDNTAIGISLVDTAAQMSGTTVTASPDALQSVLVRVSGGNLHLSGMNLNLAAKSTAYGLLLRNTQVELESASVRGLAQDLVVFASLNQVQFSAKGLDIQLSGEREAHVVRMINSNADITESAAVVDGKGDSTALQILDGSSLRLSVSRLENRSVGAAFLLAKDAKTTAERNVLSGWNVLVRTQRPNQGNVEIINQDDLESLDQNGSLFADNQVQRGL